nr:hypothetical protein Q903MT_gene2851 [Picea sitchensis]
MSRRYRPPLISEFPRSQGAWRIGSWMGSWFNGAGLVRWLALLLALLRW